MRTGLIGTIAIVVFIFASFAVVQAQMSFPVIGRLPDGRYLCGTPRGNMPCDMAMQIFRPSPMPPVPPPPPPPLPTQYPAPPLPPPVQAFDPGSSIEQYAQRCAQMSQGYLQNFEFCTGDMVILNHSQQEILDCATGSRDQMAFAQCAAQASGIRLTRDESTLAKCAWSSDGNEDAFTTCAASIVGTNLTPEQQQVVKCAADNNDVSSFATCSAESLIGPHLSRDQRIAVECAADSGADVEQFAVCAGTKYLNIGLNLNPEQQIAVECVVTTGGQPYAAAGCIATALTARELEKCFTEGIGGHGCFGDTNDLVGRRGFVMRTLDQIAGGSNSVVRNPQQILGGPNSVFNNPGQLTGGPNSIINRPLGGSNSVFNNPAQLTGGSNSMINNPGQILGGKNSVVNRVIHFKF